MKTAAVPLVTWHVETQTGRNLAWDAPDDLNALLRDLNHYGHVPVHIEKYEEYQKRLDAKFDKIIRRHAV